MSRFAATFAAVSMIAAAGCSDDPPPASGGALVFEPGPAPAAPAISLRGVEVTPDRVVLEVVGHGLDSLYGVAWRLSYAPDVLALHEMTPAPAWTAAAAREGAPGLLVAGISGTGTFPGADVDGDALATLRFDLARSSPTSIDFVVDRSLAEAADGTAIADMTWVGGALVVR